MSFEVEIKTGTPEDYDVLVSASVSEELDVTIYLYGEFAGKGKLVDGRIECDANLDKDPAQSEDIYQELEKLIASELGDWKHTHDLKVDNTTIPVYCHEDPDYEDEACRYGYYAADNWVYENAPDATSDGKTVALGNDHKGAEFYQVTPKGAADVAITYKLALDAVGCLDDLNVDASMAKLSANIKAAIEDAYPYASVRVDVVESTPASPVSVTGADDIAQAVWDIGEATWSRFDWDVPEQEQGQ